MDYEKTDASKSREEWEAVSRQSEALQDIDDAIKSDEPAGEKLKKLVEDHGKACDDIKEKLADHGRGTTPQSSPASE